MFAVLKSSLGVTSPSTSAARRMVGAEQAVVVLAVEENLPPSQ